MPDPRPALAALDKLLADKPNRNTHDFSAATRCLTRLRDAVLAEWGGVPQEAARRGRLDRLNAVISVVYGTHYPIGSPKWEQLERARDDFAALAQELA